MPANRYGAPLSKSLRGCTDRFDNNRMTEEERIAYALAQREACRPMECSLDSACWVLSGAADALQHGTRGTGGAARCIACGGKLLLEQWRTPDQMGLPSHGRLLTRGRGRSQRPDLASKQRGDSGASGAEAFPCERDVVIA